MLRALIPCMQVMRPDPFSDLKSNSFFALEINEKDSKIFVASARYRKENEKRNGEKHQHGLLQNECKNPLWAESGLPCSSC